MDDAYQYSAREPLRYDYQAYDKIWQRVAPELNPYPEARAAEGQTAEEGIARDAGASASVSSADDDSGGINSTPPDLLPGAQTDPCCMGSAVQEGIDVIRGFIENEAADRRFYQRFACSVRSQRAARLLRQMAVSAEEHMRLLQAVHYLAMGECYHPTGAVAPQKVQGFCPTLRRAYHEAACTSFNYRRSADATGDACLQQIFQRMGEEEMDNAARLLELLSRSIGS